MGIEIELTDFDDDDIIEYAKELMGDRGEGSEITDEWLIGYLHDIKKNNYALWFTCWEPELKKLLEEDY